MSNYRTELVQVAAVALAAAQCKEVDTTAMQGFGTPEEARGWQSGNALLAAVHAERLQQELKWGTRDNGSAPPPFWLVVLLEEVGEVAEEVMRDNVTTPQIAMLMMQAANLGTQARKILEG